MMKKIYVKPCCQLEPFVVVSELLAGSEIVQITEEEGTFDKDEEEEEVINSKYNPFTPWEDEGKW